MNWSNAVNLECMYPRQGAFDPSSSTHMDRFAYNIYTGPQST